MRTLLRSLDKVVLALTLLAAVAMVGLVAVIMVDVAKRALGMEPLVATNEIAQYMAMVLLVFLALPITFWRGEAISAPLVVDRLSPRLQKEFALISDIAVILVMLGVAYYGYEEAGRQHDFGEVGLISGYPLWWVRYAIPLSAVLCILTVVGNALARSVGVSVVTESTSPEEVGTREGAL